MGGEDSVGNEGSWANADFELYGNIDADPKFVDAYRDDFHLRFNSPCIDAAYVTPVVSGKYDFEGDPRVIDGDSNGSPIIDIGADEYKPSPLLEKK